MLSGLSVLYSFKFMELFFLQYIMSVYVLLLQPTLIFFLVLKSSIKSWLCHHDSPFEF